MRRYEVFCNGIDPTALDKPIIDLLLDALMEAGYGPAAVVAGAHTTGSFTAHTNGSS